MRNDNWRGALGILAWFLGATALLALAGSLGSWNFNASRRLGQHLLQQSSLPRHIQSRSGCAGCSRR